MTNRTIIIECPLCPRGLSYAGMAFVALAAQDRDRLASEIEHPGRRFVRC